MCPHKTLYTNAHSTVTKSGNTTNIHEAMNGLIKNVVYAYNGILPENKKRLSTNTHDNADEPYRHYST